CRSGSGGRGRPCRRSPRNGVSRHWHGHSGPWRGNTMCNDQDCCFRFPNSRGPASIRRAGRGIALALLLVTGQVSAQGGDPLTTPNASGLLRTFTASGTLDTDNPFFQPLGSNGRSCDTCHRLEEAWSVTPAGISARFEATDGNDPIFRVVDGATSPLADVS